MPDPGQLSVNERVLLHLSRLASDVHPDERPVESSQAGIASSIGISRTHVPRAVKALMKEGLLEEVRARVAGHERRMSVYAITPEGVRRAAGIWKRLSDGALRLKTAGRTETVLGSDLERMVGRKRAIAMVARARDGVVEMDDRGRATVKDLGEAPEPGPFHGRREELKAMTDFLRSDAPLMAVLGNRGYGTTTLARRFVEGLEGHNVLWMSLEEHRDADGVMARMLEFARRLEPGASDPLDALRMPDSVIVFDGYHSVLEEMVELLASVVERADEAKVVLTAREDTPAYNWFYHKREVESGRVQELRLKGLDQESVKAMLGNPRIASDALRRIHVMTRGSPDTVRMLREGDHEGLKKGTVLTSEEIRYLYFLKDKTD